MLPVRALPGSGRPRRAQNAVRTRVNQPGMTYNPPSRYSATQTLNPFQTERNVALSHSFIRCVSAAALLLLAFPVVAQTPEPSGWSFSLDGGFAVQSEADLDREGGAFSNDRDFWSLGVDYRWNYRNSIGVSLGIGSTEYDFVSAPGSATIGPWSDMDEWRVSLPSRWALGDTSTLFIICLLYTSDAADE